jgi:hypothetical protein
MRGHFIHMKPIEIVKSEHQRYLIDDLDLISEQRFITKKYQSEIPIFFKIQVPNEIAFVESVCPKCNSKTYVPDHLSGKKADCNKCRTSFELLTFNISKFTEFKKESFYRSESFFKVKFSTMIDNYQMCT